MIYDSEAVLDDGTMELTDVSRPALRCPVCGARRFQEGACTGCRTVTNIRIETNSVLGSYQILDVLGQGGMGVVYLASHTRLGRRVALKVLRPEYGADPHAVRRFFAEARAVNKIAHPNIIEITDFVENDDSNYYVMELLEGVSLAEDMEASGVLPLARSIGIMTQLADALGAVHAAGIIHRDIKPHNVILIERAGRRDFVKLVDFGIAKLVGVDDVREPGIAPIFGTPKYMSPEQASGQQVDGRSDVYGFGVMLYEVVTGALPFDDADFGALVVQHRTVAPLPPSQLAELPGSLEQLILECLSKAPNDRPQHMSDIAARLGDIADEHEAWRLQASLDRRSEDLIEVEPTRIIEVSQLPADVAELIDDPVIAPPPPTVEASPTVFVAARPRRRAIAIAIVAVAVGLVLAAAGMVVLATRGSRDAPDRDVAAKLTVELATADERIAAGRFVGTGGDEALDHLLAARALDANAPGVVDRLRAIARRFEKLADEALAAGSLEEAAAHLQTVLAAEPANAAAARRMEQIETDILARQRLPKK